MINITIKPLFFLLALLLSIPVNAVLLDNLFRDLNFEDAGLRDQHELIFKHLVNDNLPGARSSAIELTQRVADDFEVDILTYAKVLTNAGILNVISGNNYDAMIAIDKAIELTDSLNKYHIDLLNILRVRSFIELSDNHAEDAIESLRRAQHIAHRHDGVYSKEQLPIIQSLASIRISQGQMKRADSEQRFNLKVSEQVYGVMAEELIPTLDKLAGYFSNRASQMAIYSDQKSRLYRDDLYRLSISLFNRSIAIIEDKYGPNDLRLVDPLKGLSRARFIQGGSKSLTKEKMERATSIVATNPSSDTADLAKAIVDLADTYVITADRRALDLYSQAWDLLAGPDHDELRYEMFGTPKRLYPDDPIQPILHRHPMNAEVGVELFVDLEYDIRHDGRVRNVKVIEGNVPNINKKMLKSYVAQLKYRPRIVEGEFSITEGLSWHQTFKVLQRGPAQSVVPVDVRDGT